MFYSFYYVVTGVHLIHVLIGLIVLGTVIRELRNPGRRRATVVESGRSTGTWSICCG
jgi:nitric oxide reductase NorE protein